MMALRMILSKYTKSIATNISNHYTRYAGVSLSRNIGVRHSRGKWIMFIDSDDQILDDALNVISCYLNTDADVIFFKYEMDGKKANW